MSDSRRGPHLLPQTRDDWLAVLFWMLGIGVVFICFRYFPRDGALVGLVVVVLFWVLGVKFSARGRMRERSEPSLGPDRLSTRGLREGLGWRAQRLSDRMSGLEVVGSLGGAAVALFFLGGGVYVMASGASIAAGLGVLTLGVVMAVIASLSTGQYWWRRRVAKRLQEHGATAVGEVTDIWTLAIGYGNSALAYRFVSGDGRSFELVAWDTTPIVRRWSVGDKVRVRYDPSDPRIAMIIDTASTPAAAPRRT